MSYRTLLVHVDDSRRCDVRVALTFDLAQRWDAHVIGLYLASEEPPPGRFGDDEALAAGLAARRAERRQTAKDAFLAAAERAGRVGDAGHAGHVGHAQSAVEWRAPAGPALDIATLHARHADLVVLGQPDPASFADTGFVGDVVQSAGRPVLVVPRAGALATLGENVLIAWDGSREAARALADALPLLARARFVNIDSVVRTPDPKAVPGVIDVAAWLDAHGVRASFSATPRRGVVSTGATLLGRIADLHADLLVMGAYGHSRAHERVWGGVTRTMLEFMTVPVLMAC